MSLQECSSRGAGGGRVVHGVVIRRNTELCIIFIFQTAASVLLAACDAEPLGLQRRGGGGVEAPGGSILQAAWWVKGGRVPAGDSGHHCDWRESDVLQASLFCTVRLALPLSSLCPALYWYTYEPVDSLQNGCPLLGAYHHRDRLKWYAAFVLIRRWSGVPGCTAEEGDPGRKQQNNIADSIVAHPVAAAPWWRQLAQAPQLRSRWVSVFAGRWHIMSTLRSCGLTPRTPPSPLRLSLRAAVTTRCVCAIPMPTTAGRQCEK